MIRIGLVTCLLAACAWAAEPAALERAQREVIVKWRSLPAGGLDAAALDLPEAAQICAVQPALPVRAREDAGLERISVLELATPAAAEDLVSDLRLDPRVEYAELRPLRYLDGLRVSPSPGRTPGGELDGVPDDPFYSLQWGLRAIEAEAAWNITRGDPAVVIAVIDVGVSFAHPELSHARWTNSAEQSGSAGVDDDGNGFVDDVHGWDFVDDDNDPTPFPFEPAMSHGTHVAGIAAAARNNGQGIAGLAPHCRVMDVRVGSEHIPFGYEGIYYAARSGAKIINCSWGGSGESAYEHDILNYARSRGCVVIAAAGNGATLQPHYPAAIEGTVSVGATAPGDQAASFSHYGSWVKISAPGTSIISTIIGANGGYGYDTWQGTSMSAPLVAAACALVASRYPGLDGDAIAARIASSADPIDEQNPARAGMVGLGRLNVWRALADSVAGVRSAGVTYAETIGNGDGRIRGGEVASLRLAVINDLAPIPGLVARLSTPDPRVSLFMPTLMYGEIPHGGPVWSTSEVVVELPPDIERGYVLPLVADWVDPQNRLVGRAALSVLLDSTFVSVDNDRLALGFGEQGSLGYDDPLRNVYLGPGLRVSDHSNALFDGSFLLAADGAVSDNGRQSSTGFGFDWSALPDSVAHIVSETRADIEARASFRDWSAPQPLFARADAAALAWSGPDRDGFLVLEYTITNGSVNAWQEAFAGFFLDWDLGSASANLASYDAASGIAWVQQVAPGHPLVGIMPLAGAWDALAILDNRVELDTPAVWNDAAKWNLLRSGFRAGSTVPRDVSFLCGVGPFSLAAHASHTVAFIIVTGASLAELQAAAATARQLYTPGSVLPPPAAAPPVSAMGLYPNPLPPGESLRLVLPDAGARARVRFYNLLGQLVAELPDAPGAPHGLPLNRASLGAASGVLFYRIEAGAARTAGRLLILK